MDYKNFKYQGWGFIQEYVPATDYDVECGYAKAIGDLWPKPSASLSYDLFCDGKTWLFLEHRFADTGKWVASKSSSIGKVWLHDEEYRLLTMEQMLKNKRTSGECCFALLNGNCPPQFTVDKFGKCSISHDDLTAWLKGKQLLEDVYA